MNTETLIKTIDLDKYYKELNKCYDLKQVSDVYEKYKEEITDILFYAFDRKIMELYKVGDKYVYR